LTIARKLAQLALTTLGDRKAAEPRHPAVAAPIFIPRQLHRSARFRAEETLIMDAVLSATAAA
jgi:hypothetical protein